MRVCRWMGLVAAMLMVGTANRAEAAFLTFTDLASWSAAVGPAGIETFNGFATDTSYVGVSIGLAGGMSVTGTAGSNGSFTQKIDAPALEFTDFYSLDGSSELLGDVVGRSQFVRFDFGTPLSAWSAATRGIADGGRPTTITVYDASDVVLGTILMASAGISDIQFYGFSLTGAELASYLTITNASGANDVFGIDDVRFVATAPEPATMFLLGTGVAAVLVRRRRRD